MFYNFQYASLSPPWLNVFLHVLFFLDAIINGIGFLIYFLDYLLLVYRNMTTKYVFVSAGSAMNG